MPEDDEEEIDDLAYGDEDRCISCNQVILESDQHSPTASGYFYCMDCDPRGPPPKPEPPDLSGLADLEF